MGQAIMNKQRHFVLSQLMIVAVILTFSAPSPLMAQQLRLMPDMSDIFQPALSSKDAARLYQGLTLNDQQRVIIDTLIQDHDEAFATRVFQIHGKLSELQPLVEDLTSSYERAQGQLRQDISAIWEEIRIRAEDPQAFNEIQDLKDQLKKRTELYNQELEGVRPERLSQQEMLIAGEAMIDIIIPWQEKQQEMMDEFEQSVLAILQEDQASKWPAVRRAIRRDHDLPRGLLSGEAVDLIQISRDLSIQIQDSGVLKSGFLAYDKSLDQALIRREEFKNTMRAESFRAALAQDEARILSIIDQELTIRQFIRDLQDRHAIELAGLMTPEEGSLFRETARTAGFTRIYRPTRTRLMLNAAGKMGGLDTPTSAAIQRLQLEYLSELKTITDTIYERLRANEPRLERLRMAQMLGVEVREEELSGIREGFDQRTELDRDYRKKLEDLITPEQMARLSLQDR